MIPDFRYPLPPLLVWVRPSIQNSLRHCFWPGCTSLSRSLKTETFFYVNESVRWLPHIYMICSKKISE